MRRRLPDILIIALLFALPLVLFWQQTIGERTLLPAENLYQYEPFASYREEAGAPTVPHNALLSDLVLENFQWKTFIREQLAQGEIPLWNPNQFAGIPFLAAGQPSTLYPFSVIYTMLPLPAAYGWFTVVQLWLAGVFMFAFMRGLGAARIGALIAGVVYQLSGFFVISTVFPMIIAAAVWLPLLLLMAEFVIRQQPALRGRPATAVWVAIGAVALGCNILAGHVEITYYTLIILAYWSAARLLMTWWKGRKTSVGAAGQPPAKLRWLLTRGAWLAVMVTLGIGLGAAQFIPLFEHASTNFRVGSASYEQVIGWAHPIRDVLLFLMPNFYGSPAHHVYTDVFNTQVLPASNAAQNFEWGMKNYVEGASYIGILPLALAAFAVIDGIFGKTKLARAGSNYRALFILLTAGALTLMFGLPTYALLYYLFPGIDQLHSPFRWIFAVTLGIAALAGLGADALVRMNSDTESPLRKWANRFAYALIGIGALILVGLALSYAFYGRLEPLIERIRSSMALAPQAFAAARMFYSYEFTNVLLFGLFTLGAGVVFWLAGRKNPSSPALLPQGAKGENAVSESPSPFIGEGFRVRVQLWQALAVSLIALDMVIAWWGFNPASDPALLDYTPPAIQWLVEQHTAAQAEGEDWRYITLEDPTLPPIMNANVGWRYGLDDVRGYESIIPKQYVDYMEQLAPQVQLDYNRIAPLYTSYGDGFDYRDALQSPLLPLLNVRYVITHASTELDLPDWQLAYNAEVRIWELNPADQLPRAYTVAAMNFDTDALEVPGEFEPATITQDSGREVFIDASVDEFSWLIVSQSYSSGWRAFVREQGADPNTETPLMVGRVFQNFQGVQLEAGDWTVRLVYSPTSFQVGLFASFISLVLVLLLVGIWLWRLLIAPPDKDSNQASIVARNSVAPILLNLFNRGIDFAFAAVMLRVLGPADSGDYQYAIVIFVWFDILTNFGLNLFLTREVARNRERAAHLFWNTSALRLVLAVVGVIPLVLFLSARQNLIAPPLRPEALLAIGLLYVGLLPNSLSTGLTALFYGFERAEVPAVVATVATLNKAVFGLVVLLAGFGFVGLAGVSIFTNLITLAVLFYLGREMLGRVRAAHEPPVQQRRVIDIPLLRGMSGQSWPLMLNHLLATVFFQIDIVIIEAMHGSLMVGQYGVAYKWLSALNVIPSFFTQALLPMMSRQAHEDREALKRNYALAIKLLVSIALPLAALFTFLAYPLTALLGGAEYLPDGAVALQLMIWSIPIGWINSLTQYVLIALDLQRRITRAFALAVGFNLAANLIFVPQYGYKAAAIITILSEAALLVPFALLLRGAFGPIIWLEILWRPVLATVAMMVVLVLGWSMQPFLALVVALVVYPAALLALRLFTAEEAARLMPLLPRRMARQLQVFSR